jgi:colanic acid/amylovoran biosynthesis glycosyltransferase
MPAAIAYITTRYPAMSHTFILHEVNALRDRGVDVHTVSICEATGEHLLSGDNRRAFQSTYAIRPPRWGEVIGAHSRAFLRHPRAYMATLRHSLGMARPGLRGRVWQVFYFAEAIMLWFHCAKVDARHVHAHHGSPPADVSLLATHFGELAGSGPSTWSMTIHGPTELWNTRWFRLPEKIEQAHGVVCISDFARSQVMALVEEEHWAKLEVVHCGLIPERYREISAPQTPRPQILSVGRLVPEKGHAVLIKAHAALRRSGHDVDLVLVGSGPGQAGLERLAAQLGVADHVIFTGPVGQDEIKQHYAAASLFCSSSFSEGVPGVLMEAMACGCPVVATAIAGVRELVHDGETGLIVSPGRVDELARAIARLLEDSQLHQELSERGRQYVDREFNIRRSAITLERFFQRMLGAEAAKGSSDITELPLVDESLAQGAAPVEGVDLVAEAEVSAAP